MATTTLNASKDGYASYSSGGTSAGAGQCDHLIVGGGYDEWKHRSFIGFSYSFTGWTAITSATLYVKTTTEYHVARTNASITIYADRITSSWSEGTYGATEGWSSTNALEWTTMPACTTSGRASASSPDTDNTWVSWNVTSIMQAALAAGVFYGIRLMAANEGQVTEYWSMQGGSSNDAYISVTYSTNTAPNAPTGLSPTGDTVIHSLSPTFAGFFSDPDAGDTMTGAQVEVYADDGTTLVWQPAMAAASGVSFSIAYAGGALTGNTFYRWRGRTKDAAGAVGAWSALQRFKVNSVPNAPWVSLQESPTSDIVTLTPTFSLTHNDPDASDSQMVGYRIALADGAGNWLWDTGYVGTTATTTKMVTYNGPALSWQSSYQWIAMTEDSNGAWSGWSANAWFTTHTTGVPISLDPSGSVVASSLTPSLTGVRGYGTDTISSYQIRLFADDGVTQIWDSGTLTTGITNGASFSKVYSGTALSAATYYKWQARITGSIGGTSAYSALQRFATPDTNTPNLTAPVGSPITSLTPSFQISRGINFNRHEMRLYPTLADANAGTNQLWADTPSSYAATGSKSVTYPGTPALTWNTTYYWKARVSADGGTIWSSYGGPVAFSTDSAGQPTLTAPINNSWQTTQTPTFTGNTYNAEVITYFRILLYAADQTTLIWDSGDLAGSSTSFSKVYNGGTTLTKGAQYYWKARYTKSTGPTGNYSAFASFHVNADPSTPTNMTPSSGAVIQDTLTPTFTATFADTDLATWGDTPSKYEVEVQRVSDSVQMYTLYRTTSIVAGSNSMKAGDAGVTQTAGPGGSTLTYNIEYQWRARYTDSKSAIGPWSSFQPFKPSQSPTTAMVAPGATVNSPSFLIDWSFTGSGGKAQATYRVQIVRSSDSVVVHDSTTVVSSVTQFTLPTGYLVNSTGYSILVDASDTDGLAAARLSQSITTSWTAPDAPADFGAVADDTTGTVALNWTITNLADADFSYYQIYRRIPGAQSWTPYARVTTKTLTTYKDYYAAIGVSYDYYITVFKKVAGDVDLESVSSDISNTALDNDAWFVIGADRAPGHCFELPVSDAPFSEPVQQESFEPLGTRRKVIVRGRPLGAEGTLQCKWRDEERATVIPQIAYIRENAGPHILKSPFGDIWEVEFSGPEKNYRGGGHLDVTLVWTEVA